MKSPTANWHLAVSKAPLRPGSTQLSFMGIRTKLLHAEYAGKDTMATTRAALLVGTLYRLPDLPFGIETA